MIWTHRYVHLLQRICLPSSSQLHCGINNPKLTQSNQGLRVEKKLNFRVCSPGPIKFCLQPYLYNNSILHIEGFPTKKKYHFMEFHKSLVKISLSENEINKFHWETKISFPNVQLTARRDCTQGMPFLFL